MLRCVIQSERLVSKRDDRRGLMDVKVISASRPSEQWATVRIRVPIRRDGYSWIAWDGKAACWRAAMAVAKASDADRVIVRCLPRMGFYCGYIKVYKRPGTKRDHVRFSRAVCVATRLVNKEMIRESSRTRPRGVAEHWVIGPASTGRKFILFIKNSKGDLAAIQSFNTEVEAWDEARRQTRGKRQVK